MRKLLSANLSRLWLNKAFWLTAILMASVEVIYCLLLLKQSSMPRDYILFISFPFIGIFISVFFSLFLGTEYHDGTIRNKIIVGHKRSSVYSASFITGIIAVTIIYLAVILTGCFIGAVSFASPHFSIGQIMVAGLIGWLACVSYIAIFNLVGMLSPSKARTSIICILIAFILLFAGLMCYSLLQPGALSGAAKAINQFLFELNPFGQTFLTMSIDIASPWKLAIYSLLLSSILTGLGMCVFHKKDLK